jgi:hypothetical protein
LASPRRCKRPASRLWGFNSLSPHYRQHGPNWKGSPKTTDERAPVANWRLGGATRSSVVGVCRDREGCGCTVTRESLRLGSAFPPWSYPAWCGFEPRCCHSSSSDRSSAWQSAWFGSRRREFKSRRSDHLLFQFHLGVAQPGRARALGARGRRLESARRDQSIISDRSSAWIRALPWGGRGRGFESRWSDYTCGRWCSGSTSVCEAGGIGSIPIRPPTCSGVVQWQNVWL